MKRMTSWLGMALLCMTMSLSDIVVADTKIIYINGKKAPESQINEVEKAFGVTLLPNSRFILDYATGNFYQSIDKAYIGNIYEYAFFTLLEEAATKQQTVNNNTTHSVQRTTYDSTIYGSYVSDGNCSYVTAGGYTMKSC
ncbi:MAG: hypothetical protein OEX19_02905 [Gammaproteobacteria bacterium]|nr:hypothetical protein [Gammaproteobacteria bacterium]